MLEALRIPLIIVLAAGKMCELGLALAEGIAAGMRQAIGEGQA
jgi:hypothetical protein